MPEPTQMMSQAVRPPRAFFAGRRFTETGAVAGPDTGAAAAAAGSKPDIVVRNERPLFQPAQEISEALLIDAAVVGRGSDLPDHIGVGAPEADRERQPLRDLRVQGVL